MRILLDTHVLLWWLADDPRLDSVTREVIGDARNSVSVSAATVWEMAIKSALGKLTTPDDVAGELEAAGFDELAVTITDAVDAGALPRHHDDPFDRMLIAQAVRRDLTVLTVDRRFSEYDVRLLG